MTEDPTAHSGYAIVPPSDVDLSTAEAEGQRASLTSRFGCSDTRVDVYRTRAGTDVVLPTRPERLCVPIHGRGTITADATHLLSKDAIAFVSAGTLTYLIIREEEEFLEPASVPPPVRTEEKKEEKPEEKKGKSEGEEKK